MVLNTECMKVRKVAVDGAADAMVQYSREYLNEVLPKADVRIQIIANITEKQTFCKERLLTPPIVPGPGGFYLLEVRQAISLLKITFKSLFWVQKTPK